MSSCSTVLVWCEPSIGEMCLFRAAGAVLLYLFLLVFQDSSLSETANSLGGLAG